MKRDCVIIGAGPAGLAAAAFAPEGALVLEARKDPGWKILISGGGHCNVTNSDTKDEYVRLLGPAGRFLKHALYEFGPEEIRRFLAEHNCPTVAREEGHIYPKSNRAADVLNTLLAALTENGSEVATGARVTGIKRRPGGFALDIRGEALTCSKLLIASGTPAFDRVHPEFDAVLRALGHTARQWVPGLAPVPLEPNLFSGLAGLSTTARVSVGGKWRDAGELLVTDDGLSGPAVMNASAWINRRILEGQGGDFLVDLLPASNREETLHALMTLRDLHPRVGIDRVFEAALPKRLAERLIAIALSSGLPGVSKKRQPNARAGRITASELKREDAMKIAALIHACPCTAAGIPTFSQGYVASGGIPLGEVNSRTMESRKVPGLFFAGEILDYDAPSGGYNITLALATGRVAGEGLVAPIEE